MPVNIPFTIQECSGEASSEADNPSSELLLHSQDSRGWSTPKDCLYPQTLTLRFEHPGRLQQFQILSHEYKIAGKVEIQATPPDEPEGEFTRLGFMSFDPNERTQFSARELKSVTLPDVEASALRLVFHRCHNNALNIHNQACIIMINIVGEPLLRLSPRKQANPTTTMLPSPSSVTPTHFHHHHHALDQHQHSSVAPQTSPVIPRLNIPHTNNNNNNNNTTMNAPGTNTNSISSPPVIITHPPSSSTQETATATHNNNNNYNNSNNNNTKNAMATIGDVDSITAMKIQELHSLKLTAIDIEDYDEAKRLKHAIDRLKTAGSLIASLEIKKIQAVAVEDYDSAKELKAEIEESRQRIYTEIFSHEIPSHPPPMMKSSAPSGRADQNEQAHAEERKKMTMSMTTMRGDVPYSEEMHASSTTNDPTQHQYIHSNAMNTMIKTTPTPSSSYARGNQPVAHNAVPPNGTPPLPPAAAAASPGEYTRPYQSSTTTFARQSHDERPARARGSYDLESLGDVDETSAPPGAVVFVPKRGSSHSAPMRGAYVVDNGDGNGQVSSGSKGEDRARRTRTQEEQNPQNSSITTGGENGVDGMLTTKNHHNEFEREEPAPDGFPQGLPTPEPLSSSDIPKESDSLLIIFGEYLIRCVYSRVWQLREAAFSYLADTLDTFPALNKNSDALRALSSILAAGLKERIGAVVGAAMSLVSKIATTPSCTFSSRDMHAMLVDIVPLIVERAADGAPRSRDHAVETLTVLAKAKESGLSSLTHLLLKAGKKGELPRTTLGRVQLVGVLLPIIGICTNSNNSTGGTHITNTSTTSTAFDGAGFEPTDVMRFASPALTNASAEVRAAAVDLVLKLGKAITTSTPSSSSGVFDASSSLSTSTAARRDNSSSSSSSSIKNGEYILQLLPNDINPKLREQLESGLIGKQPVRRTSHHGQGSTGAAAKGTATTTTTTATTMPPPTTSAGGMHAKVESKKRTTSTHGASRSQAQQQRPPSSKALQPQPPTSSQSISKHRSSSQHHNNNNTTTTTVPSSMQPATMHNNTANNNNNNNNNSTSTRRRSQAMIGIENRPSYEYTNPPISTAGTARASYQELQEEFAMLKRMSEQRDALGIRNDMNHNHTTNSIEQPQSQQQRQSYQYQDQQSIQIQHQDDDDANINGSTIHLIKEQDRGQYQQKEEEEDDDVNVFVNEDPLPFERELKAREVALGPYHPDVAEAASNLAIIYNQRGDALRALPLYQRALSIWEKIYGEDHADVAHALTDIAVILLECDRDEEGKVLLRRALKIQEKLLGGDHPDVVAIRDVLMED